MEIYLIKNEIEYFDKYPYQKKYAQKNIPKKYPCILSLEHEEGGLGGSYIHTKINYIPEDINDIETYFKGTLNGINISR